MTMYVVPTSLIIQRNPEVVCNEELMSKQALCKVHLKDLMQFTHFRSFIRRTLCSLENITVYTWVGDACVQHDKCNRALMHSLKPPVVMTTASSCSYVLLEDAFPYGG